MRILQSRLLARAREERDAELKALGGEKRGIGFGSQIRSYVLHPYQMVKDHRTGVEVGNIQGVLDGDLDRFIEAELRNRASALAEAAGA
jgi:peptide chain release factor 2